MPVLSHLSLKASYSLTADRGPSSVTNSFVVIRSENPWRPFTSVKESQLYISSLANSELTYEKKHELNIGLALGLLDNRINIEADWYTRNNFDLIGIANTAGVGGEVRKYGNIASMKSDGVEFTLSTVNVKTKDFSWTSNFIYSHTHNIVTDLKTSKRIIDLVSGNGFAQEGYPVRAIFSIPFKGLNEEGLPTFLTATSPRPESTSRPPIRRSSSSLNIQAAPTLPTSDPSAIYSSTRVSLSTYS